MKVLVACDESQAVCSFFRSKGHEAYSCDIQECSGPHPEWHIQGDVLNLLNPSKFDQFGVEFGILFYTQNIVPHFVKKWDIFIDLRN